MTAPGQGVPGPPREGRRCLLFRVDDRLLHGQVVLGWGVPLGARAFLVADDLLASDADAVLLYEGMAPEGSTVRILALETAEREAAEHGALCQTRDAILVVRGLAAAARLLRAGVPGPLNLGGLHLREGARERLPYLFLTPDDEALLRSLAAEGHEIFAQDLPRHRSVPLSELLGRAGAGEGG